MLQDRGLAWYVKYTTTNLNDMLAETKTALNKEFRKPNLECGTCAPLVRLFQNGQEKY